MVATRRGAKKAPEAVPAPSNTLNAPPKRGGGRKKTVEEAATEPAPVITKPTKPTATKRKAKSEPEDAEIPLAKKTTATSRATRVAKVETKADPAPVLAAPKRATRGKKVTEVVPEEPAAAEEAPKPTATRGRKVAVKKAPLPKVEEPVVVPEPVVEEAPKPAPRGRKAPVKKTAVQEPVAIEPAKPVPRARKAAIPKQTLQAPVAATRPTRGRNAVQPPQESPLKAPARKVTKKAAVVSTKVELPQVEEPFTEFPGYPTTPAHITAPLTSRRAMAELPNYPNTPAHILAPISSKDALAALPDYPKTPAHITAPISTKAALAELAGYPKTPAHIKAPMLAEAAITELPEFLKTPAQVVSPVLPLPADEEVKKDLSEYVNTPIHTDTLKELPDYPETPAHIQAPMTSTDALNELPGYPETPAHIQAPMSSRTALAELPVEYPKMPAHIVVSTPTTIGLNDLPADCSATPAQIMSPVTTEESAIEYSEGPRTPTQFVWGVTSQEAFAELPEYPKTPVHITAPVSNRDALAELPSYPATPAMQLEAAIQEEITASVKKQTPSPLRFANLSEVSVESTEVSVLSAGDPMDVDIEPVVVAPIPKLQLAPVQLSATIPALGMASPKKSALRSPQKFEAKTPKKAVTWNDKEDSELFLFDGPLQGLTFLVDITSKGHEHNFVFASLLEDLGAKVVKEWEGTGITHVLFKDGNMSTLEKVIASKGAIKCVNVGWVLDCESNKKRVDEASYLVDLSVAMPKSPAPTTTLNPFTPARTPSKYALPPSSECRSIPSTPTSSEFDRSINIDDDKENSEVGLFFQDAIGFKAQAPRTCPPKKSSVLFSRSPMKTPSKPSFLTNTALKPFSTTKKRTLESSLSFSMGGAPKKFRLF